MKRGLFSVTALLMTAVMVLGAAGCGKASSSASETAAVVETVAETAQTASQTESVQETNEMRSYYTGEWISRKKGTKRPYAIMINNIEAALPQYGIGSADMVYEAMVEGTITRLMMVIQDVSKLDKIGSIRSARHYYIDFANDNDAIYVHFGQSKYAKARIEEDNIKTISGLSSYGGKVFYRTTDRVAPHNVFTSSKGLKAGLKATGISRDYEEGYTPRFEFNTEDTVPADGYEAVRVNIPFSYNTPYFTYDEASGTYLRFQYGKKHIDALDNSQLAFKNIIVQYVKEKTISKKGHQDLRLNGTGKGWYITDGKAVKITWKRDGKNDRTIYYDSDGNPIKLNVGKTMFEYVPKKSHVSFGEDKKVYDETEAETSAASGSSAASSPASN